MSDNEDNARRRFDPGSYHLVAAEYSGEIRELAHIAESPSFDDLLVSLADYPRYLEARLHREKKDAPASPGGLRGEGIVDTTGELHASLREALDTAHVAACCHLLHGSRVSRQQLTGKVLEEMARQFSASLQHKPRKYLNRIVGKFHAMDAIRTMQLLRNLGLVQRSCEDIHQLAIGAADGTRDVLSLHIMPQIDSFTGPQGAEYHLHAEKQSIANAIIIDSDTRYKEHYAALTNDPLSRISAFNMDTIQALNALPDNLEHKRNMVTALRIDHRMINDVPEFLSLLGACVDDNCDFILSIGAGDTPKDFEGRIRKVQEIFSALRAAGLEPLIFKFHSDGDLEQQWNSLRYGNPRASSYQLLHCRIDGEALQNKYF